MPANSRWDLIRRLRVNLLEPKGPVQACNGIALFDIWPNIGKVGYSSRGRDICGFVPDILFASCCGAGGTALTSYRCCITRTHTHTHTHTHTLFIQWIKNLFSGCGMWNGSLEHGTGRLLDTELPEEMKRK